MRARAGKTRFLTEAEGLALIREFEIPYPRHRLATTATEAREAARELGLPVVLKIVSPQIIHKSDSGGVVTGLGSLAAVGRAFSEMKARLARDLPEAELQGALICRQADQGSEVIVGGLRDEVFGPVVMFGLGGIFAEALRDVAFRVAPVDEPEAHAMITEIQGYSLLSGLRGSPPADIRTLAGLLVKVSKIMVDRPEIVELDLNPIRAYENGALALDVRVGLAAAEEKAA